MTQKASPIFQALITVFDNKNGKVNPDSSLEATSSEYLNQQSASNQLLFRDTNNERRKLEHWSFNFKLKDVFRVV